MKIYEVLADQGWPVFWTVLFEHAYASYAYASGHDCASHSHAKHMRQYIAHSTTYWINKCVFLLLYKICVPMSVWPEKGVRPNFRIYARKNVGNGPVRVPERMSEYMACRMPNRVPEQEICQTKCPERMSQLCRKECQNTCQKPCLSVCLLVWMQCSHSWTFTS